MNCQRTTSSCYCQQEVLYMQIPCCYFPLFSDSGLCGCQISIFLCYKFELQSGSSTAWRFPGDNLGRSQWRWILYIKQIIENNKLKCFNTFKLYLCESKFIFTSALGWKNKMRISAVFQVEGNSGLWAQIQIRELYIQFIWRMIAQMRLFLMFEYLKRVGNPE